VTENFRYVEAVAALRGGRPKVVRSKTCTAKLPGLYQATPALPP
jgi:hypothetical protein